MESDVLHLDVLDMSLVFGSLHNRTQGKAEIKTILGGTIEYGLEMEGDSVVYIGWDVYLSLHVKWMIGLA